MIEISTPISAEIIQKLRLGDFISISGDIYCGRDTVLPKIIARIIECNDRALERAIDGSVIFHTAVSVAGVGPTSSNKVEIEESMRVLAKLGVRIHLGKGDINQDTINILDKYISSFAIIPPVTALLIDKIIEKECIAFPELGMEAFYRIKVVNYPAVIGCIHGRSIYDK